MIKKITIAISLAISKLIVLAWCGCERAISSTDSYNHFTEEAEESGFFDYLHDIGESSSDSSQLASHKETKTIATVSPTNLIFLASAIDTLPLLKTCQPISPNTSKVTATDLVATERSLPPQNIERVPPFQLRTQTTPQPLDDTAEIAVKRIELKCGLEGNKTCLFDRRTPEIATQLQALEQKNVTVLQLRQLADRLTKLYTDRGYITSGAIVPAQNVDSGIISINLVEAGIENIQIEGLKFVKPEYLNSRIRQATTAPVNIKELDERLRLLRNDTLFRSVDFQIAPGTRIDRGTLKVKVVEAPSISGTIGFDNYSSLGVGAEKLGTFVSFRNWSFSGDRLLVGYRISSTGGSKTYDLSYELPLSNADDTLQVRGVINDFKLTDPQLIAFNINGKSDLYEVNYRRPIVRSPTEEFGLSVGFSYQDRQIFLGTQPIRLDVSDDDRGKIRSSVVRFSQDYTKRDERGAWVVRSNFNFGTGLFNANQNPAPIPDGGFWNWSGQAQRWHRLSDNNLLVATLSAQLSPTPLMQLQQFYFSEDRTIRGYRQNARVGDNGLTFSIEERITMGKNQQGDSFWQFIPFIDAGVAWNHPTNPKNIFLPKQNFLIGAGIGINWVASSQFDLRIDFSLPLINIQDRSTNLQDNGIYFRTNYRF